MVGENKGKEGKSPGLDLRYKRNSTHEYEDKIVRTRKNGNKNERRTRYH